MIRGAVAAASSPAGLAVANGGSCAAIVRNIMIILLLPTRVDCRSITGGNSMLTLDFATTTLASQPKGKIINAISKMCVTANVDREQVRSILVSVPRGE
jgi:hypothetical protein